jgi:ribosomal protein L16 Arg81 hydroxylase
MNRSLPTDLESLLAPTSADDFIRSHWSQALCHVPGWPGKFTELLPWNELNRILDQHRLDAPRLRLVMSGKEVNPHTYTDYNRTVPRLMVKEFCDQLSSGATIVLEQAHELYRPLTALSESLELRFGVPVDINVYAATRTCQALDAHWDDHEVFIVQVSGSKRWLLFDRDRKMETGTLPADPIFDRILEDGALLYIPRGYWHAAVPLDAPCLHLTVGVSNPAATDLLAWLAKERRFGERPEMVLSRLADQSARLNFLQRLKNELTGALTPELLERYFDNSDATRRPNPHFSMPWSVSIEGLPHADGTVVRMQSRRAVPLRIDAKRRAVEVAFDGKTWRFPLAMKAVFDALENGRAVTIEELVATVGGTVGEEMAYAFLTTLLKEGIICVVADRGSGA